MCDGKLLRELERRRALPSRLRARLTDEPAQTRGSHTSRNASVRRRIAFVYRSPPHRVSPFLGALSSAAMNATAMTAATRVADGADWPAEESAVIQVVDRCAVADRMQHLLTGRRE